jgi:thioredoxin reductase
VSEEVDRPTKGKYLDAIVVGGGPAGLSAALLLGRCRREVALFDEGRPRNFMSPRVHCYLGLPDSSPRDLLATGRAQLAALPNVAFHRERVEDVERTKEGFRIIVSGGAEFRSRALIVASGLIDRLPALEGVEECYGISVFPCPYCDGWENSDRELGVLGSGDDAARLALELLLWSERVSLFLTGDSPSGKLLDLLDRREVAIYRRKVTGLRADAGRIAALRLADGTEVGCEALFLVSTQIQHHDFLEKMGCKLGDSDQAECDESGRTQTPGLFVAGNAKKGLQLAMVAAADGLKCAAAANDWLLQQQEK